jgi:acyl-CoA reductase-like NAD-dependent aldehyde dehydrogenase
MEAKIYFGSSCESRSDLTDILNPYNGNVVSRYPQCSVADTKRALAIAEQAKECARKSPLSQRIAWLEDVAEQLKSHKEEIAKTLTDEVGKPIAFSKIEVDRCIETIKITAAELINLHGETISTDAMPSGRKSLAFFKRVPIGVAACITPFNFPLNLVAHKIAPALGAGNCVVLKPTPEAPLTAYKFAKLFIDSPHAIPDALSLVYGDAEVGSTLVSSEIPRVVSFTGSMQVGEIITKSAGIKKVSLELGGNAATFIDASADLQSAAAKCAFGAFYNSGQVCISLQRIYVDASVYDAFSEELKKETEKLIVGDPYDEKTFIGPLINEEAARRAMEWIASAKEQGAVALCGDKCEGRVFYPTVMRDVTDDMNIVCQEAFAPIVSLVKVADFNEALQKTNNSPYGLQYSIFTNDLQHALEAIEEYDCGGVVVNDIPTVRFDIQPYGGTKLSGIGKEGPKYALEEFTEIKSVVVF